MKYHHGNLKEKLIQSAYDWISENGIEGISLRKIAKISNVSQTAPYRHFSSKEHLLADVTKLGFENFSFKLSSSRQNSDPIENLVDIGIKYINFGMKNQNIISLMFDYPLPKSDYPELLLSANNAFAILQNRVKVLHKKDTSKNQLNSIALHAFTHGLLNIIQMNERIDQGRKISTKDLAKSSDFYKASKKVKINLRKLLKDFIKNLEF